MLVIRVGAFVIGSALSRDRYGFFNHSPVALSCLLGRFKSGPPALLCPPKRAKALNKETLTSYNDHGPHTVVAWRGCCC
jgi:hypothetical protein